MIDTRESITAKLCSFARAYHSNFERKKIFDDYLAYDIMGKEEHDEIGQLIENDFDLSLHDANRTFCRASIYPALSRYIIPIPLSRIAFAEKALQRFAEDNDVCQYVICGAGMDTFAFRNENPAIRIFEVDHPDTQRYKLGRITQLEWIVPENVRYVPVDFDVDDMIEKLEEAGFDRNIPAFFAILGVTYYLTLPVFEQTVGKISRIAAEGSRIVFDFPDETTFTEKTNERVVRLAQITAKLGEPMLHGFTVEEIREVLQRHGFVIREHETPKTIQKNYFERRDEEQTAFENIHFILAEKRGEVL